MSGLEYPLESEVLEKDCGLWLDFSRECLKERPQGIYLLFGSQLYLAPPKTPRLKGLKVLRPALHLGTNKKNRFEPSHALALYLKPNEVNQTINFASESSEIHQYLSGEAIHAEGEKGWNLVTVDGYSIGWGKLSGGILKNHYPKGLRFSGK